MMNGTSESSTSKCEEVHTDKVDSIEFPTTNADGIPIRTLYVGNLPRNVKKREVITIFSEYGKVTCTFPVRKKTKSYAFITYTDVNNALKAQIAAARNEIICQGVVLKVDPSDKQPDSIPTGEKMSAVRKRNNKKQKKTQEVEVDESSTSSMNILDDDCLIKIFSYLSISDRLRIERVCKRWQSVNSQCWSDIKDLKLDAISFILASFAKPHRMNDTAVHKILIRCGRFLNALEINSFELDCTPDVIPYIAKYCHNLECLSLYMDKYPNEDLSQLFVNTKRLSNLKLYALGKEFSGDCLWNLPVDSITEISLHAKNEDDTFATSFRCFGRTGANGIKKMRKLWKLELNGFLVKPSNLKAISRNNAITHLTFSNCSLTKGGNHIANLRKLKYLDVAKVIAINDIFLAKLATQCHELQYLNISECVAVTNAGINAIAKLNGLETLKIDDLYDVSGTVFSQFKTLKVLHCQNCHFVGDDGLIELIRNSSQLEELNLCGTRVSTAILETAYLATTDRDNPVPLRIIVNSSLENEWVRPPNISSSVLIIEKRDENLWDPYWTADISGDEYDDLDYIDYYDESGEEWEYGYGDFDDEDYLDPGEYEIILE